jgi:phosphoribosylglycinamide formyltransferase 1
VTLRVGVLASGAGTNLQAILDRVHGREAEVVAVGSDKPEAAALERARAAGVAARAFPRAEYADRPARDAAMAAWLGERGAELVVLAGYMQILSPAFLAAFPQRVVNVHPALLPAFPGIRAVEQALDYGVKVFGVTVHFVDEGVDTGPIIAQQAVSLPDATDADAVRRALRPIEHDLLTRAVRLIARGGVRPDPAHPRRIQVSCEPDGGDGSAR